MTSDQAAAWILSRYPLASDSWGEALLLLPHRSWKKPEQKRLADYYFKKIPFSSSRRYEAFASIMSVKLMVACINDELPKDPSRLELLFYHLVPVLKRFAKKGGIGVRPRFWGNRGQTTFLRSLELSRVAL
ncbi:hypothetical protein [Pseudomonas synxantha]|uniref:hypothetical protein n=1 Tax=Pseudomonas synxantha TaxID=47883 RepID=UPI001F1547B4|nr:hypothetical protein [Pseudomonas synxantha]